MDKLISARTLLSGFVGGLTLNLMMILTFRLLGFGIDGGGILLDPSLQSSKLIAVWLLMNIIFKIIQLQSRFSF